MSVVLPELKKEEVICGWRKLRIEKLIITVQLNINMLVKSNATIWVLYMQNYEMYTKYIWKTSNQETIWALGVYVRIIIKRTLQIQNVN
jgi:hypothetical protein